MAKTTIEHRVLRAAGQALKRTTGIEAAIHEVNRAPELDLMMGRRKYRFRAEVKTIDRFATPGLIKAQTRRRREPVLLVAPFITREVAEYCRQLHLPFIDTAGNAYLEAPGLLIYVVGQGRPAAALTANLRALNPAGLRIAFAILCQPALLQTTYRKIAAMAGVALGTVGPVIQDLEARGYLRFRKGLGPKLVDPERMIEEWVTHYPVALRPKLNPRRFQAEAERLKQMDPVPAKAYWGGEPAAEKLTGYLKPAQFTIYAREPVTKLVAAARMRADATGNVEILNIFWNFEADPEFPGVVPPLLAYADLLATHDGRNTEAARMIYEQRLAPAFHIAK